MNRRVLVTGASGFIGRRVVRALVDMGCDVVGASRRRPDADPGAADWIVTDLLADGPHALVVRARADTMVHLAWIATPGLYGESPENLDWLRASTALCATFLVEGGRRLVAAGTCWEGGLEAGAGPMSLYAKSKNACRIALEGQVAATPCATLAWARIFYLLGADDHRDRLAPSLARRLAAGEPAEVSARPIERDFIDVRDCGRAIAGLALTDAAGIFDIASGRGLTVRQLAEAMARAAGRPELAGVNPKFDRPGEPARLVGDPTALRRATGFAPALSLEQTIADILRHWQSAGSECAS
jgi:nucleoside-diphosphate-sugar epimerase